MLLQQQLEQLFTRLCCYHAQVSLFNSCLLVGFHLLLQLFSCGFLLSVTSSSCPVDRRPVNETQLGVARFRFVGRSTY